MRIRVNLEKAEDVLITIAESPFGWIAVEAVHTNMDIIITIYIMQ